MRYSVNGPRTRVEHRTAFIVPAELSRALSRRSCYDEQKQYDARRPITGSLRIIFQRRRSSSESYAYTSYSEIRLRRNSHWMIHRVPECTSLKRTETIFFSFARRFRNGPRGKLSVFRTTCVVRVRKFPVQLLFDRYGRTIPRYNESRPLTDSEPD